MKKKILFLLALPLACLFAGGCSDDGPKEQAYVPPTWEKNVFPGTEWKTASPEKYGYRADTKDVLDAYMEEYPATGVMVVIGGESVYSWGTLDETSYLASARKSILSMLYGKYVADGTIDLSETIGGLIDDGVIADDVGGLLPVEKQATVKDCIAARSGVYHQGSNSGDDYAIAPIRGSKQPGTYYLYNNWDFNVSGAIFEGLTGQNIYDAFGADLATPLGMEDWDRALQVKGGDNAISVYRAYHFYLSARDMARLGYLMLRGGKWNGTQVVPAAWCVESTRAYTPVDRMNPIGSRTKSFGYGYMWWVWDGYENRDAFHNAYMASGAGGQYFAVLPALDMVVAQKRNASVLTDSYSGDYFLNFLRLVASLQLGPSYLE